MADRHGRLSEHRLSRGYLSGFVLGGLAVAVLTAVLPAFAQVPLPVIQVDKTATPLTMPEPGGDFTFDIVVTNLSNQPVTIISLTDDQYGNVAIQGTCTTAIGVVLASAPGPFNTYSCSFSGNFSGGAGAVHTDVVTATVVDSDGNTVSASDDATVTLTGPPPSTTTTSSTTSTSTTSTTVAPTTTTTQGPPTDRPTAKDQCKKDGWKDFGFKNQGQCVSFVARGRE